jgi:DNA modification methylase
MFFSEIINLFLEYLPADDNEKTNYHLTVMDPFMGTGSTGVACATFKTAFVGIEKDHSCFKV